MPMQDITPSSLKIDKLIYKIEDGEIKIPAFQRGFVWDQAQVIELLESIYRNFPIGSLLLWNSTERLKAARNIGGFRLPERKDEYPINYVLDGQQRVASIYGVFCRDRSIDNERSPYSVDQGIFDIYFDLSKEIFEPADEIVPSRGNFKMALLFDDMNFTKEIRSRNEHETKKLVELQSIFKNYEIPIITTNKRAKEEVGLIFERINNTGTRLTTLDLMIAWTWEEDFHLKEKIDEILETLEEKDFEDTPHKIILQCLCSIVKKSAKTKDILRMRAEDVRAKIDLLKVSLEKTVDFLSTQLSVASRDFLPHSHQMVPLCFYFSQKRMSSPPELEVLKKWFWRTSFSRRYSGSTDQKMNDDIEFFANVLKGDFSGLQRYSSSVNNTVLVEQKFSKSNPYTRAFLLLLSQKSPLNLVTGEKIDVGSALAKYNLKEYHHIFPRSFLKSEGFEAQKISSICNYCFLPSESNKRISNKAPSDYLFDLTPRDSKNDIFRSNIMPLDIDIYKNNDYDQFLEKRADEILAFLNDLA